MSTEWVDFKKVKGAVDMQMVLDHYGITGLTKSGEELRGPCPVHKGSQRSKDFTVNLRKNAFKCFSKGCVSGNVLDFVAAMEQSSVRDAALKLHEWFKIGERKPSSLEQGDDTIKTTAVWPGIYSDQDGALFEVITTAKNSEDSEPLVVYRELFGDYRFWVAPTKDFAGAESRYNLVKLL
jgi:hypothetical protein